MWWLSAKVSTTVAFHTRLLPLYQPTTNHKGSESNHQAFLLLSTQGNAAYITNIKKNKNKQKRNRHQYNTDDGGQAVGEEMRHVQMSR